MLTTPPPLSLSVYRLNLEVGDLFTKIFPLLSNKERNCLLCPPDQMKSSLLTFTKFANHGLMQIFTIRNTKKWIRNKGRNRSQDWWTREDKQKIQRPRRSQEDLVVWAKLSSRRKPSYSPSYPRGFHSLSVWAGSVQSQKVVNCLCRDCNLQFSSSLHGHLQTNPKAPISNPSSFWQMQL